jgi:hypothetical protein
MNAIKKRRILFFIKNRGADHCSKHIIAERYFSWVILKAGNRQGDSSFIPLACREGDAGP